MRGVVAMTNEQKNIIRKMRMQNETYAAISSAVGIPIGTIKSYCHRHNPTSQTADTVFCKNCGADIKKKPKAKPRLFCCDQCRMTWWKAHPDQIVRKKVYAHTCFNCGDVFHSHRANSQYCSRKCFSESRRSEVRK